MAGAGSRPVGLNFLTPVSRTISIACLAWTPEFPRHKGVTRAKSNQSPTLSNRSPLSVSRASAENEIRRQETGMDFGAGESSNAAFETKILRSTPQSRGFVGLEGICLKCLYIQRLAGGGSRTRTYEGIARGFTVPPLCRSGHSPTGPNAPRGGSDKGSANAGASSPALMGISRPAVNPAGKTVRGSPASAGRAAFNHFTCSRGVRLTATRLRDASGLARRVSSRLRRVPPCPA